MSMKEDLWRKQGNALRDPVELFTGPIDQTGLHANSLTFKTKGDFIDILAEKEITLLISREYENLLIGLTIRDNKLLQTFFHLPHPSGIAVDRENAAVYVAATRNPNQIIELKPVKEVFNRLEDKTELDLKQGFLMPSRAKYFSGAHYFHELAFINIPDYYMSTYDFCLLLDKIK